MSDDLNVNIAKVDADKNPGLLQRFQINSFPKLLYFRLGTVYDITGLRDGDYLFEMVKGHKYIEFSSAKVPKPLGVLDSFTLKNFLTLPFYVHVIWIVGLSALIAFILPSKVKTN